MADAESHKPPSLGTLPPELLGVIVGFVSELDQAEEAADEWDDIEEEDVDDDDDDDEHDAGPINNGAKQQGSPGNSSDSETSRPALLQLCLVNREFAALCQSYIWRVSPDAD